MEYCEEAGRSEQGAGEASRPCEGEHDQVQTEADEQMADWWLHPLPPTEGEEAEYHFNPD